MTYNNRNSDAEGAAKSFASLYTTFGKSPAPNARAFRLCDPHSDARASSFPSPPQSKLARDYSDVYADIGHWLLTIFFC